MCVVRRPGGVGAKAILNVAGSGKFSSDRTIAEYAADIWKVEPCPVGRPARNAATSPELAGHTAPSPATQDGTTYPDNGLGVNFLFKPVAPFYVSTGFQDAQGQATTTGFGTFGEGELLLWGRGRDGAEDSGLWTGQLPAHFRVH